MLTNDLFNTDYERRLAEGAVDQLEQRRIDDLNMKMDELANRVKSTTDKAHRESLLKAFLKCKEERDGYYKVRTNEGAMKDWLWKEAERLDRDAFVANAGEYGMTPEEAAEWWNSINGPLDEAGIGQDIVNRTEKMARATPPTKTGAVASTVKNAAKWLAGKGGPGKEGPTYEGKDDAWQKEGPWTKTPKAKSGKPVDPRGEVTHLSDVARREAERKAQAQKKSSKEVAEHGGGIGPKQHWQDLMPEGFQDFNKVEPYAVCLAGKPVKKFDYYEEARRFHDNWKQKLYREGDKEKADKITLMPLNLDEEDQWDSGEDVTVTQDDQSTTYQYKGCKFVVTGEEAQGEAWWHEPGDTWREADHYNYVYDESKGIDRFYNEDGQNVFNLSATNQNQWEQFVKAKAKDFVSTMAAQRDLPTMHEAEDRVDPILIKALNNMPDGLASHHEVLDACYDAYAMELGKMRMKSEYGTTRVYIPKLMDLYKQKHGLTFNEAANPAQQAAIAVAMKKAGKKPKHKQGIAEVFIRDGADWDNVLRELNVFNDVFLSPDIQDTHEYTRDPEWQELAKMIRNSARVQEVYAQLKKFANLGVKLTSPEVERLDSLVWDGGGDMDIDRLKDLYAHQLGAVEALIKTRAQGQNNTRSSQTMHEQGVAEDTVQIPHKGKMVSGRVVRKDPVSGDYIVDVGEYGSVRVPAHKVKQGVAEGNPNSDPWYVYAKQNPKNFKKFKTYDAAKAYAEKHGLTCASAGHFHDKVKEGIVASGPSRPLDDRAVRKMVWDTMKINADTGEQALQRALAVLAKKPQSRMVQDLQDKFQNLSNRLAQGLVETTDVKSGMAKIYNKLAPKIERHRDSFLAGQLYDELENYAELHGAEDEFKRMMNGARNRAHMEYDTNPGGFQNWFWFLPFGDEIEEGMYDTLGEDQDTGAVESAIIRRIMVAHVDWLQQFGPEKVMQAAEEVAYNVGDVDEIGTSDVSAYVHEVGQILGVDQLNEKWSQKYKSSINCASPKGFSQRAHCAGKKK